jgi:hypothetical protein
MLSNRVIAAVLVARVILGEAAAAPAPSHTPALAPSSSVQRQAPLPAATGAPIRQAQGIGRPLLYWTLGGAAIITGVILLSQADDEGATTATTASTGN